MPNLKDSGFTLISKMDILESFLSSLTSAEDKKRGLCREKEQQVSTTFCCKCQGCQMECSALNFPHILQLFSSFIPFHKKKVIMAHFKYSSCEDVIKNNPNKEKINKKVK